MLSSCHPYITLNDTLDSSEPINVAVHFTFLWAIVSQGEPSYLNQLWNNWNRYQIGKV